MENGSMGEATHQANSLTAGAVFAGVLLAFFLIAFAVAQIVDMRPIDHTDANCIYYADQRAPVVVCKVAQP